MSGPSDSDRRTGTESNFYVLFIFSPNDALITMKTPLSEFANVIGVDMEQIDYNGPAPAKRSSFGNRSSTRLGQHTQTVSLFSLMW